jgi:hypothetical protein
MELIYLRYVVVICLSVLGIVVFWLKKPDIPLYSGENCRKLSYSANRKEWYKGAIVLMLCFAIVLAISIDGVMRLLEK